MASDIKKIGKTNFKKKQLKGFAKIIHQTQNFQFFVKKIFLKNLHIFDHFWKVLFFCWKCSEKLKIWKFSKKIKKSISPVVIHEYFYCKPCWVRVKFDVFFRFLMFIMVRNHMACLCEAFFASLISIFAKNGKNELKIEKSANLAFSRRKCKKKCKNMLGNRKNTSFLI